ncbi:unnamed protein product [Prunus armeniaca]
MAFNSTYDNHPNSNKWLINNRANTHVTQELYNLNNPHEYNYNNKISLNNVMRCPNATSSLLFVSFHIPPFLISYTSYYPPPKSIITFAPYFHLIFSTYSKLVEALANLHMLFTITHLRQPPPPPSLI